MTKQNPWKSAKSVARELVRALAVVGCCEGGSNPHRQDGAYAGPKISPRHVRPTRRALLEAATPRSTQLLQPWVPGAQMRCKLPVALPLVVLLHIIYRAAGGHTQRVELPCAFGTSPTLEALCFNPHHLSTHCGITSYAIYEEGVGVLRF